ncbi:cache domain-containing protein [Pseudoduganella ginsengisoli]|uniref:Histidine kinase n=1 Tax=Pseudoduganella ginsengisoli TaxID=1462440 RepID=A0A6L6Q390_9BURK|nr:cache domain-containing protein [Pseudoduganella ginsengisoli]MTW03899.1 histidine kinase [Pseudoduganella ginsengisoli]
MVEKWLRSVAVAVCVAAPALAMAQERGTAEEAVALVKKGAAFYKANGKEKLAAEINSRSPMFQEKDLYLFMSPAAGGALIAHGANAKMVGKTLGDMRDVDGVNFVQKFRDVANSKEGKGWVDYKWPNAKTGQLEQKSTYIERVDDVYLAAGIYKGK